MGGLNKELRTLNPDLILDLLHYKTYLDILLFFLYIFITARNLICKIMIDDGRTQSSTKEIILYMGTISKGGIQNTTKRCLK